MSDTPNPSNNEFISYTNDSYGGDDISHIIPSGTAELKTLQTPSDQLTDKGTYKSLAIGSGLYLNVYDHNNFSGSVRRFTGFIDTLGNETRHKEIADDGTWTNSSDWNDGIPSYMLTSYPLYDADTMMSTFLKQYKRYSPMSTGMRGISNGYTNYSNPSPANDDAYTGDAADWDFKSESNRHIDFYEADYEFRQFWPLVYENETSITVNLVVENMNTGDNAVAYIQYSIDKASQSLNGKFLVSYHAQTPPTFSEFELEVAEGVVSDASEIVKELTNLALDAFVEGAGKETADKLITYGTQALTFGISHLNELITAFCTACTAYSVNPSDIHFPNIAAHAIVRSLDAVGQELFPGNTDAMSIDLDGFATNLDNTVWDTSTYNPSINLIRQYEDDTNIDCYYRVYTPEYSGMLGGNGMLVSCMVEPMSKHEGQEVEENTHCSLTMMYDNANNIFALAATIAYMADSFVTTGLITKDGDGNINVTSTTDSGTISVNVIENSTGTSIRDYFVSTINSIMGASPFTYEGQEGDLYLEFSEVMGEVIDAMTLSIN